MQQYGESNIFIKESSYTPPSIASRNYSAEATDKQHESSKWLMS